MIQIHDITNSIFTSKTYILCKEGENKAWLVDIGDVEPVVSFLRERNLTVAGVFLTHAHFDHIYGVKSLMDYFPNSKIYATAYAKEGLASDKLVLHQANHFMLKKLAKAVGFDHKTQMPVCMNKYGNTSSVSIPMTISSELSEPVDHIFMIGMGAGLASGIADISLKGLKNLGVIEKSL